MSSLAAPLRALLVGLAGVLLAWLWFNGQVAYAALLALAAILAGALLDLLGRSLLPGRPKLAVRLLEWWILTPAAIAAVASAAVVVITVALTIGDDVEVSAATKELIASLSTGITAFVTAAFINWSGDDKDSQLADHIKEVFRHFYKREGDETNPQARTFPPGSAGERWVYSEEYSGIEGWGRSARIKRAEGIAAALSSRGQANTSEASVPGREE